MKVIFDIAKAELRLLFYSPIAWLLLLCFTMQTGMIFTGLLERLVLEMNDYGVARWASESIFAKGNITLWDRVLNILYLYIPLLTMGCISRDFSNGSIKLFYSSPLSNLQIVLGKYLSLVFYALVLTGVLAIYVFIGWFSIENFEAGWIWTGWLGILLLTCTYMAIGLFMSSLTSYQIISAVGTFVVFMLLSMIKGWGQQYDFVREITYWLSIDGRAHTFIQGVLCSEDLIYFPTIIGLFLSLTVIRLHAVRQKQRWYITFGKNMVVVVAVCLLAYFSSRPALLAYYDATYTKKNTLTPNSQEVVKRLDGGMTITAYVNVLDPGYISYRYPDYIIENQRFFRQYTRFKPEMKIKTVYYYAEPDPDSLAADPTGKKAWAKARLVCEKNNADSTILKNKEEIDKLVDLSEEGYKFIWQMVRENGQKEWLRTYEGFGLKPGEAEITVAMKRMVLPLPKIGYITGHQERDIHERGPQGYYYVTGAKRVKFSVWNQGYDIEEITLKEPIPEDVNLVMIADPMVAFSEEEESYLQDYINRGGNLFILGETRRRDILNPMLRRFFGLELTPLLVQNLSDKLLPNVLAVEPTSEGKDKMYHLKSSWRLCMPTSSGIEIVEDKGYTAFPVTQTDTASSCWTELETTDFVDDSIIFNPTIGEISKVFTTVMGLYRKVGDKEQRILISGDADVLANNEFIERRGFLTSNERLLEGACWWLSEGAVPIDVRRPGGVDNKIFMSVSCFKGIVAMFHWIIPILLLGLYLFLWFRRRGH